MFMLVWREEKIHGCVMKIEGDSITHFVAVDTFFAFAFLRLKKKSMHYQRRTKKIFDQVMVEKYENWI